MWGAFFKTLGRGLLGTLSMMIPVLPGLIQAAESIFGSGKGKEKAQYVESLVVNGFGLAEFVAQQDIVDEQKFAEGLRKTQDGIVQMLNASVWYEKVK